MTFPLPLRSTLALGLLCSTGLLGLSTLLTPTASYAQTWGRPPYGPPPLPHNNRWAWPNPNGETVYDNDPSAWRVSEAEMAQRCNMGRLVGGLIGGGVGYATSRKEGRSWAVPLGALLGSQMGCNVGHGRGPVPW
ncbi:MAG: glycine zipper 2TM domain-containing protein [Cyanobacteriota bacterium]|nr:glycine zipper 2TM domain-containing protein [Cyanobacteriota bacterium]